MPPAAVEIARAVRLNRKWTVLPARATKPQQCKLCSSDLQMLGCNYIQKGLVYSMAGATITAGELPPLPYSYFGNAIQFASATITAGELLQGSMPWVAGLLHRIISVHQDANIRAELDKPPTVAQLDKSSPKNTVMMGSSPRFPMYDNDFGCGRPVGARSGWANKFDGKMSAYPGRQGTQSVDIEICLLPHTMNVLESDPHFLVLRG